MARFWYSTAEAPGRRRHLEAPALPEALLTLCSQGVTVAAAGEMLAAPFRLPRVTDSLLTSLYEQLASLLDRGVELTEALRRLAGEAGTTGERRMLGFLAEQVAQGMDLSEAMAEQPRIFAEVVGATVAAGEASGDLPGALRSLAEHQRDLQRLGADLALPLGYPIFLLIVVGGLLLFTTIFLGVFIMPKFLMLFKELGMKEEELPLLTKFGFGMVRILVGVAPLLIVLIALSAFYHARGRFRTGWLWVRPMGLAIAIFPRLALAEALARTCAALRLLLGAGVPAGRAVRLAGPASGSRNVNLALRRAQDTLAQGGRMSEALARTALLPGSFVFALASAEASGTVLQTLEELETDYRREVKARARRAVLTAGPLVVVALGVVVGVVGISMYLPLVHIINMLSS